MKNFSTLSLAALMLVSLAQPSFADDRMKGRYSTQEAVADNLMDAAGAGTAAATVAAAKKLGKYAAVANIDAIGVETVIPKTLRAAPLEAEEISKILNHAASYDIADKLSYKEIGGATVEVTIIKDGGAKEVRTFSTLLAGENQANLKSQLELLAKDQVKIETVRMYGIQAKAVRGVVNGLGLLSAGVAVERAGAAVVNKLSVNDDACGRAICSQPSIIKRALDGSAAPAYQADMMVLQREAARAAATHDAQ